MSVCRLNVRGLSEVVLLLYGSHRETTEVRQKVHTGLGVLTSTKKTWVNKPQRHNKGPYESSKTKGSRGKSRRSIGSTVSE